MKKGISFLLALILLLQSSPLSALAETPAMTETELTAAYALAGYGDDAPLYHDGMAVNENMTAKQLMDYMDEILENEIHTLENYCEDLENTLHELKEKDRAAYERAITGENAGMEEKLHAIFRETEQTRSRLEYWQTRLDYQTTAILNNISLLSNTSRPDYERRLSIHRIREAVREIREIRAEMVSYAETEKDGLNEKLNSFKNNALNRDGFDAGMGAWADQLLNSNPENIAETSVKASSLFPQRKTLLGRLSPIASAEAEANKEIKVLVADDKHVYIKIVDEEGNNVQGIHVQVSDAEDENNLTKTSEYDTNEEGMVIIPISGFKLFSDKLTLDITITGDGWRKVFLGKIRINKGGLYKQIIVKDNGEPYIVGCSFDGHECLTNEYTGLYSKLNDRKFPISVSLINPSEDHYLLHAIYEDVDNKQYYYSREIQAKSDEVTYEFQQAWRQRLKPGGAKYTLKFNQNEDGDSGQDDKKVLVFVLEQTNNTSGADSPAKSGAPSINSKTYTVFETGLKMEASKLSKPLDGIPASPSFLSKMSGNFDFKFPMNIGGAVFPAGEAGFDLPFSDFIPKINVAIDGSFNIVVGKDLGDFTKAKGPLKNWKSTDSQTVSDIVKALGNKYAWQNKISKGLSEAYLQQNEGGAKLGSVTGSIGLFVGLVFGMEYSQEKGEWSSRYLQGMIGVVASLNVSLSYEFMAGPIPLTVGFNVTASLGLSFQVGGRVAINSKLGLTDEAVKKASFDPKFGGFTIFFKLVVTGFFGLGAKGLVSLTVNAYAFFNIACTIKLNGTIHLKISGGGGFFILVEIIFFHAKFTIWDSGEKIILEREIEKPKAGSAAHSDLFSTPADAEEETPQKSLPYTAADYPELTPEVKLEYGPVTQISSSMQVAEIDGTMFAFYTVPESGTNGRTRVNWRNIATGQTGTFEQALKDAANNEYRYKRNAEDGHIKFGRRPDGKFYGGGDLNLSQIDEMHNHEKFWTKNQDMYSYDDIFFDVTRISANNSRALKPVFGELYALTVLNGTVKQTGENQVSFTGTPKLYTLGFMSDGKGGLTCDLPSVHDQDFYDVGENPLRGFVVLDPVVQPSTDMTWRMLWAETVTGSEEELQALLQQPLTSSGVFQDYHLSQGEYYYEYTVQVTASIGGFLASYSFEAPNIHRSFYENEIKYYDKYIIIPGMHGGVITAIPELTGTKVQTSSSRKVLEPNYYAVETAKNGKEQLWFKSNYYGCPIEEQETIPYYRVVQGEDYDLVFWLVKEPSADGRDLYHMKAARIKHYDMQYHPENAVYTFVDLDITVPGASFQVQEVNGTMYAYWTETEEDPDDSGRTIYRLRAVAFDPISNIGTDDFVLAQFKAPSSHTIQNILLTRDQKGYYALTETGKDGSAASVYSFPFRQIAAMDLDALALDNDVIHQGENDTIMFRVTNSGNMALRSFSVAEYLLGGGDPKLVLTAHCDTVNPENNYLHLEGDDPSLDIQGKEAVWRAEPPLDNLTQNHWEVKQIKRTFTGIGTYQDQETTVTLDASEILPGQVAFFYMIIHTPSDWEGKKQLRFDIEDFTANRNQLHSLARRNGLMPPADDLSEEVITWRRNANDTAMVSADAGGMYAVMSGVPKSAVLDHDIDNLVVNHRVYLTPSGERYLSFTLTNDAADYLPMRLYCEVYLDGSETPIYMDLPYDPDSISHERTHTFDMPVSVLANGTDAKRAKVTICGIGANEVGILDNSFEVELDGKKELSIVVQPQSRAVLAGETVHMTVKATGGDPPYSYQWQQYMGKDLGWQNIMDATEDDLTLENVNLNMNGRRYRCVVRDLNQDEVISDEAELSVREKLLATGDTTQPMLYLLISAALFLAFAVYILRRRKENREA